MGGQGLGVGGRVQEWVLVGDVGLEFGGSERFNSFSVEGELRHVLFLVMLIDVGGGFLFGLLNIDKG